MVSKSSKVTAYLALSAVIIYNSWPLGYLLNRRTASIGLASDLEATGQPYNWLFIAGDVLCCLLLLAVVVMFVIGARKITKRFILTQAALVIFGLTTALSAIIPLNCSRGISACGLTADQIYSLHNLLSAVGFFVLFAGMLTTILMIKGVVKLIRLDIAALVIWSLWGLLFLFISIAGASTLSYVAHISQLIVICQQTFLTLSGILIFLMVFSLDRLAQSGKQDFKKHS